MRLMRSQTVVVVVVALVFGVLSIVGLAPVTRALAAPVSQPAGSFVSLNPARVLDTRVGNGAGKAPVGARSTISVQVTGKGGVPVSGAGAVVLNVTVTAPTAGGYLTVFPAGSPRPMVSNLNFVKAQTVPNLVAVRLGTGGKVSFYNGSGGTVQVIADVAGYYLAGTSTQAGTLVSLTPVRVLDTDAGIRAPKKPVPPHGTISVQVSGRGGVPVSGAGAVVLNVTVAAPMAAGYLTVFPAGSTRPAASNLNFAKAQTVANLVISKIAPDGTVSIYVPDLPGFDRSETPERDYGIEDFTGAMRAEREADVASEGLG